jgi:hypothetical protein
MQEDISSEPIPPSVADRVFFTKAQLIEVLRALPDDMPIFLAIGNDQWKTKFPMTSYSFSTTFRDGVILSFDPIGLSRLLARVKYELLPETEELDQGYGEDFIPDADL